MSDAQSQQQWRIGDPAVIAVLALGMTQIISWGTTLYALGVLGTPIARETGWSQAVVFGGLTAALLVSSVVSTGIGRLIDRRGAQLVMSAGSILVFVGLAALAFVSSVPAYLAAWAFLGLAMRMTLYDAAFAALVQVTPAHGRRAISYLTLFGGLASTVFWPIGFWLEGQFGWRVTVMIFAAINLVVCVPLHWIGLSQRDGAAVASDVVAGSASSPAQAPTLTGQHRRMAMILFGCVMSASAFCYGALAAHLVTVLAATGIGAAAAITLASLKGVAQTLARLGDLVFGRSLHPVGLGRITLAFLPVSFAVLLWGGASYATALAFTILFGIANGLTTIVRGAVPLALFGSKGYGEILGILATPYLVLNAIAPVVFALIVERWSVHAATVTVAVVGLIAWIAIEVLAHWFRSLDRAAVPQ